MSSKALNVVPKVRKGSDSLEISSFLRGVLKPLREGLVGDPMFKSLQALTTLIGILSSFVKDLILPCSRVEETLLLSLWYSHEVNHRHFML